MNLNLANTVVFCRCIGIKFPDGIIDLLLIVINLLTLYIGTYIPKF